MSGRRPRSSIHTTNATELRIWVFQFTKEEFAVTVVGYRNVDESASKLENWSSTPIEKRETATLLKTVSGSYYKLVGPIDEATARTYGYPASLISLFENGFPPNWKSILKDYYSTVSKTNALNASVWFDKVASRYVAEAGDVTTNNGTARRSRSTGPRKSILPAPSLAVPLEEKENESASPYPKRRSTKISFAPFFLESTRDERASNLAKAAMQITSASQRKQADTPIIDRRRKSFTPILKNVRGLQVDVTPQRNVPSTPTNSVDEDTVARRTRSATRLSLENQEGVKRRSSSCLPARLMIKDTPNAYVRNRKGPTMKFAPIEFGEASTRESRKDVLAIEDVKTQKKTPNSRPRASTSIRTPNPAKTIPVVEKKTPASRQRASTTAKTPNSAKTTPVVKETTSSSTSKAKQQSITDFAVPTPKGRGRPSSTVRSSGRSVTTTPKSATKQTNKSPELVVLSPPAPNPLRGPTTHVLEIETPTPLPRGRPRSVLRKPQEVPAKSPKQLQVPEIPVPEPIPSTNAIREQENIVPPTDMMPPPMPPPDMDASDVNSAFKVPQKTILQSEFTKMKADIRAKSIHLSNWHIAFAPIKVPRIAHHPFVIIGLHRDHMNEGDWQTSVVVRVLENDLFETYNGKSYVIDGPINIRAAAQLGFPELFVQNFCNGFPPNWRQEIKEVYEYLNLSNGMPQSPAITYPESDVGSVTGPLPKHSQIDESGIRRDEPRPDDSLALVPFNKKTTQPTEKTKRTSRGRLSHEPLAYWANERVRYNNKGEAIGMSNITTHTVHTNNGRQAAVVAEQLGISPGRQHTAKESDSKRQAVLAVEKGGKKKTKRPLVTYSDSDMSSGSDDEYIRTLREISYEDSPIIRKGPSNKRRHVDSDDSDEINAREKAMKMIRKKKRKLEKQHQALEELERKASEAAKRAKDRKKRKQLAREGDEEFEKSQKKLERQRAKQKKTRVEVVESSSSDDDVIETIQEEENRSSTETEVSDDGGDWHRTPLRKPSKKSSAKSRTNQQKIIERYQQDSGSSEEDDEEEENIEPAPKKVKWTTTDIDRLKLAIAAISIHNDDDWEKVSRSLGSTFPAEECKKTAVKKLKWKMEEAGDKNNLKDYAEVTARQGTLTYKLQTEEFGRKYMMNGGSQDDDFFKAKDTIIEEPEDVPIPDVATFDPDDSLLEAIKTPVVQQRKAIGGKRRVFVPTAMEDDSPNPARRGSARRSSAVQVSDEQRGEEQKYMHYLNSKKGNHNNTSRFGYSGLNNTTMMNRTKAAHDVTQRLDAITKKTRKQKVTRDSGSSSEDEQY